MKRTSLAAVIAALMLVLMAGCPAEPGAQAEPTAMEPAEQVEPVDTLAAADTAVIVREEPAPAEPAPEPKPAPAVEPEPRPEPPPPPPKPKALPRLWAFGADRCIPCVQMKPFLAELTDEYAGRVEVRRLDVYTERELAGQARIQMIPTQVFFDPEGKEVFRHVGFYEKDSIVARFRQFGWE